MSENKDSTHGSAIEEQGAVVDKPAGAPGASSVSSQKVESNPKSNTVDRARPGKGSSVVAWLALLLVLGLGAALAWAAMQLQRTEATINARVSKLETLIAQDNVDLVALNKKWKIQLEAVTSRSAKADAGLRKQLQLIESRLLAQREELARFGATDRADWLLAEVQYLLRLANQRLIMADDSVAAKALLISADGILVELQDVSLHDVRAAVAADLAAVRAIPTRDIQGMYLDLAALIEQADNLVIFQLPEDASRAPLEPAENWRGRLQQGYEEALIKLSDYVIIRRRDVPIDALMDPQWEGLVRQNLRMLLEQAQVALLSANQVLFRESLARANHWVTEFFAADEAAAKALAEALQALGKKDISVEMPDISRSLAAVDTALELRMQRGGGQ